MEKVLAGSAIVTGREQLQRICCGVGSRWLVTKERAAVRPHRRRLGRLFGRRAAGMSGQLPYGKFGAVRRTASSSPSSASSSCSSACASACVPFTLSASSALLAAFFFLFFFFLDLDIDPVLLVSCRVRRVAAWLHARSSTRPQFSESYELTYHFG